MAFTVLKVTPGGDIVREISMFDVLIKNKLHGLLYMSPKDTWSDTWSMEVSGDTLHLNDVEIFPSHLQPGVFEAGDVMVSLRNINAIMVFNPDTLRIKYLSIGEVVHQHDPDFVDGEQISVLDNNNVAPESQGPQSRIVVLSATHDDMQVIYSGSAEQPFYTAIMGKHQWLPNGNMLITESTERPCLRNRSRRQARVGILQCGRQRASRVAQRSSSPAVFLYPLVFRGRPSHVRQDSSGGGVNAPMSFSTLSIFGIIGRGLPRRGGSHSTWPMAC